MDSGVVKLTYNVIFISLWGNITWVMWKNMFLNKLQRGT